MATPIRLQEERPAVAVKGTSGHGEQPIALSLVLEKPLAELLCRSKDVLGASEKAPKPTDKESLMKMIAELAALLNTVEAESMKSENKRMNEQIGMADRAMEAYEKATTEFLHKLAKARKKAKKAHKWGVAIKYLGYAVAGLAIGCVPVGGAMVGMALITAVTIAENEKHFIDKGLADFSPGARLGIKLIIIVALCSLGGGLASMQGAAAVGAVALIGAAMLMPSVDVASDFAIIDHNAHSSDKVDNKEELAEKDPKRAMAAMISQIAVSVVLGLAGAGLAYRAGASIGELTTMREHLLLIAQCNLVAGNVAGAYFQGMYAEALGEQASAERQKGPAGEKVSLSQYVMKKNTENMRATEGRYGQIADLYAQLLAGLDDAAMPAREVARVLES